MHKDDLIQEIGVHILYDQHINSEPWQQVAIVVQVSPELLHIGGFSYNSSGESRPTHPRGLESKIVQLRALMYEEGKDPWRACLVRLDRESGKFSIDFEYEHPEKWLITPQTYEKMPEILRPPSS